MVTVLFAARQLYFHSFSGSVGHGTRMVLSLSLINASINCAVAEGMALADRVGIKHADLLDVLSNSACNSQLVSTTSKGNSC